MSSSDLTGSREIFQQMWKDGQKDNKKTIKLLEENTGEKLHDIGFGNDFMEMTPKGQACRKSNTKQVGLYQTKKLLHSKENNQQS